MTIGPALTDDQIEDRMRILSGVDDSECQRCATSALDVGAASDPGWFIDSTLVPNPGCPDAPVETAIIYCPRCW